MLKLQGSVLPSVKLVEIHGTTILTFIRCERRERKPCLFILNENEQQGRYSETSCW